MLKLISYADSVAYLVLLLACSPVFLLYFLYRLGIKVLVGKPIWDR